MKKKHKKSKKKYVVIFLSKLSSEPVGYKKAAAKMVAEVQKQPGFLGFFSLRNSDGFGATISYWSSIKSISSWKNNSSHINIKNKGKRIWYEYYQIQIARIIKDKEWNR